MANAWYAICDDSINLGQCYFTSKIIPGREHLDRSLYWSFRWNIDIEYPKTGSQGVDGFCDIISHGYTLADDKRDRISWTVDKSRSIEKGLIYQLANMSMSQTTDFSGTFGNDLPWLLSNINPVNQV